MAKKLIRLTEGDLHRIIKESINEILSEESYRKSAKKGEHTSVANKKELNGAKRRGNNDIAR